MPKAILLVGPRAPMLLARTGFNGEADVHRASRYADAVRALRARPFDQLVVDALLEGGDRSPFGRSAVDLAAFIVTELGSALWPDEVVLDAAGDRQAEAVAELLGRAGIAVRWTNPTQATDRRSGPGSG